jgi:hypothetical protein
VWDGGTGPDDSQHDVPEAWPLVEPYAEAMREYVQLVGAARNALNFSDPALADLATDDLVEEEYRHTQRSVESGELVLRAGPDELTILGPLRVAGDRAMLDACQRPAPGWSLKAPRRGDVRADGGATATAVGDGLTQWQDDESVVMEYTFRDVGRDLVLEKVTAQMDGEGDDAEPVTCDPGYEVPHATYLTPPDLSLLHEATTTTVVGPPDDTDE